MAKVKTQNEKDQAQSNLELLESSEALQEAVIGKTEAFAKKNQGIVFGILAILALAVGGFLFWQYQLDKEDKTAQVEAFPAVFYFEQDSLNRALKGDGNATEGFEQIISQYGSTKTGNLSNIYVGVAKLKQGQYDEAISYFKAFSSSDLLVQARVYSLIGDAYMEKGETGEAISFYKKAADYNTNSTLSTAYMMKLATAYEIVGDNGAAKAVYERIINDYPESDKVLTAKKYLAKLEASN